MQATLRPWQEQPIQQAQSQWQHVDLAVWWPGAPQTHLSGQARVTPDANGIAVFRLALAERCGSLPEVGYAGIVTLNEARTVLSAAYTATAGSTAGLFQATR